MINKDTTLKVCSCRVGFKDSIIKTVNYTVTQEEINLDVLTKRQMAYENVAKRPDMIIKADDEGYRPVQINVDDDGSSHCTPSGSVYQTSLHKRESNYLDNNDFEL